MNILKLALLVSSVSFLYYGINCLVSQKMKDEFVRFDLDKQRILTGYLQLIGAIGLAVGYFFSTLLTFIASVGLTMLMFTGFAVRVKIKDSILMSIPSLTFALINLFISIKYYYLLL